jgi:hypothetical protein
LNYIIPAFLALLIINSNTAAQETDLTVGDVEIPFIDRDGDGINDLMQQGWGLRFVERYKKRQEIWNLLKAELTRGEEGAMIDTDGDGVGDISRRDYMKTKLDELVDTDDDGLADTPLKDYLGKIFKAFDQDGDGLPDEISKEEFRLLKEEMKQWRQEIRDRLRHGLPPFIDEDGDGKPDKIPPGHAWGKGKDKKK